MKRTEAPQVSTSTPMTGRWRTALAIGAIGLASFGGYKLGQNSGNEKVKQHQLDKSDEQGRLAEAEEDVSQCRQQVKTLVEKRSDSIDPQFSWKNQPTCRKIMDQVAQEKAKRLADSLCISNSDDMAAISRWIGRGYTELGSVRADGSSLTLRTDGIDERPSDKYVHLKERPKCVSPELLEFDPDEDSELVDLKRQLKDGHYDEIVREIDLRSMCSADNKNVDCRLLSSLEQNIAQESDLKKKKELACDYVANFLEMALVNPEIIDPSSVGMDEQSLTERRRTAKMDIYRDALFSSLGLSPSGDSSEAMLRCMTVNYKNPVVSEPSKNASETEVVKP